MNLNELKSFIRSKVRQLIKENEVVTNEMARIATKIKLGEPDKVKEAMAKFKDTWVMKIFAFLEEHPDGASKVELANASGKTRQQDVNPIINKLITSGILTQGDLVTPKKEKPVNSGVRGRPLTNAEERKGEENIRYIVKKIKADEPVRPEMIEWFTTKFSKEKYDELTDIVEEYKSTGTKEDGKKVQDKLLSFLTELGFDVKQRGRPMGSMQKDTDDSEDDTEDENDYDYDDDETK
jgi:hypothetical protein